MPSPSELDSAAGRRGYSAFGGTMPRKSTTVPARRDDLIVQKLGEEVIVYDRVSHQAHSLNRTASVVFEKLDGKRPLESVAKDLGKALGRPPQKELVDATVNELASAGLLRPGASLPRRSVLRGLAAGLLPVVASLAVPPAAAAASCAAYGGSCLYDSDCCAGLYCIQTGTFTFECLPFLP